MRNCSHHAGSWTQLMDLHDGTQVLSGVWADAAQDPDPVMSSRCQTCSSPRCWCSSWHNHETCSSPRCRTAPPHWRIGWHHLTSTAKSLSVPMPLSSVLHQCGPKSLCFKWFLQQADRPCANTRVWRSIFYNFQSQVPLTRTSSMLLRYSMDHEASMGASLFKNPPQTAMYDVHVASFLKHHVPALHAFQLLWRLQWVDHGDQPARVLHSCSSLIFLEYLMFKVPTSSHA